MQLRRKSLICAAMAVTLLLAFAVFAQTENEPARLIKATRFLEEKPFDKDAKSTRSWALTWVIQTDKVSVTVCSLLVSGIDKKYKYSGEIFGQYTLGMAAFKLEDSEKAGDEDAAQLAGIESALRSYEMMLKEQSKARNAFLDDLLAKRSDGSLAKHVAENNCKART